MIRKTLAVLASCSGPLLVIGCFGSSGGQQPGDVTRPECQLDSKNEKEAGYPFNVTTYGKDILPVAIQKCGTVGACHGSGGKEVGKGAFTIYTKAAPGNCEYGQTFNELTKKVDLATPANSRLVQAVTGGSASHPFTLKDGDAALTALRGFIEEAATKYKADGGGGAPPVGVSPFDDEVFASKIAPAIAKAGCAATAGGGCHADGKGNFKFDPEGVTAGTPAFNANFQAVTTKTVIQDPEKSPIYVRATVLHNEGKSVLLPPGDADALLAWIKDAKKNSGNNPNPTCAPIQNFNLGTFRSEILPILSGDLDLNAADQQGNGAGCQSVQCHGQDRGPGTLNLDPSQSEEDLLQNFVCFVDLTAPAQSEILLCPLDARGCRFDNHPGQDILGGIDDLNYQRILGFLSGSKADVSPHDFAFFVRKINVLFDDPALVDPDVDQSCADGGCHFATGAGQPPDNGSDYPIISNAGDLATLSFNYVSSTGFVNFLNPTQSSLFLYPTGEIEDQANNPFATGLAHPGGIIFAVDSVQGLDILKWANGIRTNNQGALTTWLVAGDFITSVITQPTSINERAVIPNIFDKTGGGFNNGEWDLLDSNANLVDLDKVFPRDNVTRVAYAAAYAFNVDNADEEINLTVTTDGNPVEIYVNGVKEGQNPVGGDTNAIFLLPGAGKKQKPSLILIKILQDANDAAFAFQAVFRDRFGNIIDDRDDVVFTLGPKGGI